MVTFVNKLTVNMVTFVNKLTVHGGLGRFLEPALRQDTAAHRRAVRGQEFQTLLQSLRPPATPDRGRYETVEASA
ncbi:hypothetical protein OG272_46180 [Streptomyces sp. NBC_00104]|uniref:hypothetical protein n=1 Tax=Streptomyces sp. NBC_00104 TaxID=2903621 RepID=UPI00324E1F91